MAIDPLFWDIFGLEENHKQPLSFRCRGAWTIRPKWTEEFIARYDTSPEALAKAVIDWSDHQREKTAKLTLETMLADLGPIEDINKTQAICLLILMGERDQAERLCREADPKDWGGFSARRTDGVHRFYDHALDWIAKH